MTVYVYTGETLAATCETFLEALKAANKLAESESLPITIKYNEEE